MSEEARQQARAEGLTLRAARSTTGYFGVYLINPGRPKPYKAEVRRGGKLVYLGYFATAEEAALCVARTPEEQAAPAERPVAAPPLTSEEALQQAQGLALLVAKNKAGYFGVHLTNPGKPKPYLVQVRRGGKAVYLGSFATAEEAALCVARSPEGRAAAAKAAVSITGKSAPRQAKAKRSQHALQAGPRKPRRKRQRIAGDDGGGDDAVEEVEEVAAGATAAIEVDALEVEAWSDGDDEVPFVEAVLISV